MSDRLGTFLFGVLLGLVIAASIFLEIVTNYPEMLR